MHLGAGQKMGRSLIPSRAQSRETGSKPCPASAPTVSLPRLTLLVGLVLAVAVAIGGCSSDAGEEANLPKPSSETLDELRTVHFPVYWLGTSFRSLALSGAEYSEPDAHLGYGASTCSPGSGCTPYPIEISSYEDHPRPFLPPAGRNRLCVGRVQGAVSMRDCRNDRWVELYTGPYRLSIRSSGVPDLTAMDVARRLRAINAKHLVETDELPSLERQLPQPEPIACLPLRFLTPWWVKLVRKEFGPNPRCNPPED